MRRNSPAGRIPRLADQPVHLHGQRPERDQVHESQAPQEDRLHPAISRTLDDGPPEQSRRDRRRPSVPRHDRVGPFRHRGERRHLLVHPAQPALSPDQGVQPEHRPRAARGPPVRLDQPDPGLEPPLPDLREPLRHVLRRPILHPLPGDPPPPPDPLPAEPTIAVEDEQRASGPLSHVNLAIVSHGRPPSSWSRDRSRPTSRHALKWCTGPGTAVGGEAAVATRDRPGHDPGTVPAGHPVEPRSNRGRHDERHPAIDPPRPRSPAAINPGGDAVVAVLEGGRLELLDGGSLEPRGSLAVPRASMASPRANIQPQETRMTFLDERTLLVARAEYLRGRGSDVLKSPFARGCWPSNPDGGARRGIRGRRERPQGRAGADPSAPCPAQPRRPGADLHRHVLVAGGLPGGGRRRGPRPGRRHRGGDRRERRGLRPGPRTRARPLALLQRGSRPVVPLRSRPLRFVVEKRYPTIEGEHAGLEANGLCLRADGAGPRRLVRGLR